MNPAAAELVLAGKRIAGAAACVLAVAGALGGCAVIAAVDTAATLAIGTVGLAASTTIGVAKITGRAVGAAADAVLPGRSEKN